MNKIIIPDTSLCAIVRDEIINPAGGIIDFIDSTMPFLECGVIVDTGSKDGTKEILDELALKYRDLKIFYRKFDDFSASRNFSLGKVKTKRALILDADERLTKKDFGELMKIVEENPKQGYNFKFICIFGDYECTKKLNDGQNPRLFEVSEKAHYKKELWEQLYLGDRMFTSVPGATIGTDIKIKHFLPEKQAFNKKHKEWYGRLKKNLEFKQAHPFLHSVGKIVLRRSSPLNCPSFYEFKVRSSRRDAYR